jgi:hypothetical protein
MKSSKTFFPKIKQLEEVLETSLGTTSSLEATEAKETEPTTKSQEHSSHQDQRSLTKVQGILTSQIRTRLSSDTPAMAFFRIEECINCHNTKQLCQVLRAKHKSCTECAEAKCQECEIPVIFRVKSKEIQHKTC